jgi:hypothetical protein
VMPMVELEGENPAAIRHPAHRIGKWIPVIEIPRQAYLPSGRREAGKAHFVEGSLCRIAIRWLHLIELELPFTG